MTPEERVTRAQIAAHTRWSRTSDRTEAMKPARDASFQRFIDQVDPERKLDEVTRIRMAISAERAHMARMSLAAQKSKRLKREQVS